MSGNVYFSGMFNVLSTWNVHTNVCIGATGQLFKLDQKASVDVVATSGLRYLGLSK